MMTAARAFRGLQRETLAQQIDLAREDAFSFDGARCHWIVAGE